MELATLIGLTDSKVGFASRSTIVSACGRHICFRDIFSNRKDYVLCPGQGVKSIAFNAKENAFAIAEINENPRVLVYDSLSRKLTLTLEDAGAAEVIAMGFSAYGKRFVTVSGEPDYKVKVWDLTTGKVLVESTLNFLATNVVFHPHNKDEFVVYGHDNLVFWQVEEMYQTYLLNAKTPNLLGLVPSCCEWNPRGGLLVGCATGEVILQDSAAEKPMLNSEGKPVIIAKVEKKITSVAVHGRSVVLGVHDSPCEVFPISQVTQNPETTSTTEVFSGVASATYIGFDPYFDKAIISTEQACLFIFDINRGLSEAKLVCTIGGYHQGRITSLKFLDESAHFVSSSCDSRTTGSVCSWSIKDGSILWKRVFSSPQIDMDCHKGKKAVASVGKDGILTIVDFSAMDSPNIVFRKKMHTKAARAVSFSLDGEYLATLGEDGHIFFLSIGDSGSGQAMVRVIGYVSITVKSIGLTWTKHLDAGPSGLLLISLGTNEIMGVDPPPKDYSDDSLLLSEVCKVRRLRLDSNATAMQGFESAEGEGGTIVVIGNDKKVKQYRLPSDDQGWGGVQGASHAARERLPVAHEARGRHHDVWGHVQGHQRLEGGKNRHRRGPRDGGGLCHPHAPQLHPRRGIRDRVGYQRRLHHLWRHSRRDCCLPGREQGGCGCPQNEVSAPAREGHGW